MKNFKFATGEVDFFSLFCGQIDKLVVMFENIFVPRSYVKNFRSRDANKSVLMRYS